MSRFIEILTLLIMIILALYTVNSSKLRRSIIYLGGFSLLSSFVYLLYSAPDVAIAEAIIGCTLSVILFLTAIKKYRILTIYYINEGNESNIKRHDALIGLENYLTQHDFEPQVVKTSLDDSTLHDSDVFDLLVVENLNNLSIYSRSESFNTNIIKEFVDEYLEQNNVNIDFIPLVEDIEYEG